MSENTGLLALQELIKKLRDPENGCPWDRDQNHHSLMPYFYEELAEFEEALEKPETPQQALKELGDLLFQVAFHAELLREKKQGSLSEASQLCIDKIQSRHPHIFPEKADPSKKGLSWEELKMKESPAKSSKSPLTDHVAKIPLQLDNLLRSQRLGERAASFGFDWKEAQDVLPKIQEEYQEFLQAPNDENAQEEWGDLVFSLCQYARKKSWCSLSLIQRAQKKFLKRFESMEHELKRQNLSSSELSFEDWDELWEKSKKD